MNGGKNYIIDEEAAAEIGMIWRTEIWDDVTVPGNLLTKARTRLHDLAQGVTSMELTIVDESDTGADIGDIHAGMYVVCKSPPHGIDGRYRCVGRTRDYLNPAGNTITIGASGVTLTGLSNKQNDTISALEEDVVGQSGRIDVISGQVDRINESKMYRTELVTEGVSIFREKTQRSLVRCKVYSWDNEITDTLPASAFNWHRNSGNTTADAAWDATHTGMKTITVSTEDVTDNASFFCEVTI